MTEEKRPEVGHLEWGYWLDANAVIGLLKGQPEEAG